MGEEAVKTDALGVEMRLCGEVGEDVSESGGVASLFGREGAAKAFVVATLGVSLPD